MLQKHWLIFVRNYKYGLMFTDVTFLVLFHTPCTECENEGLKSLTYLFVMEITDCNRLKWFQRGISITRLDIFAAVAFFVPFLAFEFIQ